MLIPSRMETQAGLSHSGFPFRTERTRPEATWQESTPWVALGLRPGDDRQLFSRQWQADSPSP
jgi:hypothetical protein